MSERQIDAAIDAAVRDLMNVDADPAFRARVVDRLHQPQPRANRWAQFSLAAAALVLVLGVVLMRGGKAPPVSTPAEAPVASVAATPQIAPAPETAGPLAAPARGRRNAGVTTRAIERGLIVATVADVDGTADGGAMVTSSLELEGPIASIEVAPIAHTPIITAEIAIAPLDPPGALVVAPLDPRRERN